MLLTAALPACGGKDLGPASSLSDLVFQTRTHDGVIFSHSEIVSIGGWMPFAEVGQIFHYSKGSPPPTALAISRDHSFRLTGETVNPPTYEQVMDARDALERVRELIAEAVELSAQITVLSKEGVSARKADSARAAQRETAPSGEAGVSPTETDSDPTQEPTGPQIGDIASQLAALRQRRMEVDEALVEARASLRCATRVPGLIVAQWKNDREGSVGVQAGEDRRARVDGRRTVSGYVVLGGLRASCLAIGDDFKQMVRLLAPSDRAAFRYGGIVTFVLQAQRHAYVSGLEISRSAELFLALDPTALNAQDLLEQARIEAYLKSYQAMSNTGSFDGWAWEKSPFCFVSSVDLFDLERPGASVQGWRTILTQIIHPDTLPPSLVRRWQTGEQIPPPHSGRPACTFDRCGVYGRRLNRPKPGTAL